MARIYILTPQVVHSTTGAFFDLFGFSPEKVRAYALSLHPVRDAVMAGPTWAWSLELCFPKGKPKWVLRQNGHAVLKG